MSKQDDLEIFDPIKEGLEDAIEFHKGDRKKGKRTRIEFVEVATFDANSLRDMNELVEELSEEYEVEKDYVRHLIMKTREEKNKLTKRYELIDKGIEDAKAGRISELTSDLLEQEENKVSKLKELEKMWEEYCKASDIKVCEDVEVLLNPCEPRLKVDICKGEGRLSFTVEEIKALAKVLGDI